MHELSLALSILDAAQEEASRHGDGRVVAIHLRLGPLSGVVEQALQSAFELAREGTPLSETALAIEATPLVVMCPRCAEERHLSSCELLCPVCGVPTPDVVRGQEFEVFALELEA